MAHQDDPVGLQGEVSTSPKRRLVFSSGVCVVLYLQLHLSVDVFTGLTSPQGIIKAKKCHRYTR